MRESKELDHIAITVASHRLLRALLAENPKLEEIMRGARNEDEARIGVRDWVLEWWADYRFHLKFAVRSPR
jgi:lysine 2,3-aminomutase